MDIFLIGTDTGVGKTWVGTSISEALIDIPDFAAIKLVETGVTSENFNQSDIYNYSQINSQRGIPVEESYYTYFSKPLNLKTAAELDQVNCLDIPSLLEWIKSRKQKFRLNHLLIEGAGGLMVPINARETILDIIIALNCKVIIIVPNKLGCLNHLTLTLEVLKMNGISGWVFLNSISEAENNILLTQTNEAEVNRLSYLYSYEFLGQLEFREKLNREMLRPLIKSL